MLLDNTFIWTDRNTNYLAFLIRLASIQEEQHTPLTYRRPKMHNYTFSPIRLAFLDAVSDKKPATNHYRA